MEGITMENKKWALIALAVLCVVQLGIAGKMVFYKEKTIESGKEFHFLTAPVDPADPFRGKYITLDFEADWFDAGPAWKGEEGKDWDEMTECYVLLGTDKEGFAEILDVVPNEPENKETPYVKAKFRGTLFWDEEKPGRIQIEYPFERFYMEEAKAPEAENLYREFNSRGMRRNDPTLTYAVVFIYEGDAVMTDVRIGETSIRELAKERLLLEEELDLEEPKLEELVE